MNLAKWTKPIRDTFGITDPLTNEPYADILGNFLIVSNFTKIMLEVDRVVKDKKSYLLHMDSALRRRLKEEGFCRVIISYQVRTDLNIALARIYDETKAAKIAVVGIGVTRP